MWIKHLWAFEDPPHSAQPGKWLNIYHPEQEILDPKYKIHHPRCEQHEQQKMKPIACILSTRCLLLLRYTHQFVTDRTSLHHQADAHIARGPELPSSTCACACACAFCPPNTFPIVEIHPFAYCLTFLNCISNLCHTVLFDPSPSQHMCNPEDPPICPFTRNIPLLLSRRILTN